MRYKFRSMNSSGQVQTGYLEGEAIPAIVAQLSEADKYLLDLKKITRATWSLEKSFRLLARVKLSEIAILTRQFALMLDAGLNILECLDIIQDQCSNQRLKTTFKQVISDIKQGMTLHECLNKHPGIFSRVYLMMVQAGELGGALSQILFKLSSYLEKEAEINQRIKQASIYPVFIIVFTLIAVFMIILLVLPRIVTIFDTAGVPLPLPTRMLLTVGNFIQTWGWLLLPGITLLGLVIRILIKQPRLRIKLEHVLNKIPFLGKIINRIEVARFARTVGALVKSGVPILQALEVARDTTGSSIVGQAIHQACEKLREGERIAEPLQATSVFEPVVIQMIAVGEETGRLDDMLLRLSDYYDNETALMVDSLIKLIEPVLIAITSLLVGAVVIAILLPMFSMVSMVNI